MNTVILRVPISELVDALDLPEDFLIQDVRMGFHTDGILIKVKSPRIRWETPEGTEFIHYDIRKGLDGLIGPEKISAA